MRVAAFSTYGAGSGSGGSALRIQRNLADLDTRMELYLPDADPNDPTQHELRPEGVWKALDRVPSAAAHRSGLRDWWLPSTHRLTRSDLVRGADLVQLFNTHGGGLAHGLLPALAAGRPVVWRLSDMWPFTGFCAYSHDCDRWRVSCGECPYLDEYPSLPYDTTHLHHRLKRRTYPKLDLTVVAPSRWLGTRAQESPLLGDRDVFIIPNGIDLETFRPQDDERTAIRARHGLPDDRLLVLFGAQLVTDPRKGGAAVQQAWAHLAPKDADLVIVGNGAAEWPDPPTGAVHRIGPVHDQQVLAGLMAASDVVLLPSSADNLPNMALEALACGTPVVAYDAGGMGEAVLDDETGRLAPNQDVHALAEALGDLLSSDGDRRRLGQGARRRMVREHAPGVEAQRFLDVYRHALDPDGQAPDTLLPDPGPADRRTTLDVNR